MSSRLSSQNPSSTDGRRKHPFDKVLLVSLTLTTVFVILAICQQFYGLGWRVELKIDKQRIQQMDGYYRWRAPEQYRTPLLERRARFYENGKRWINQARATRDLPSLSPGWFRWADGGVNFTTRQGEDPRLSKARYHISTPYQFKPRIWYLLGSLMGVQILLFSYRRSRSSAPFYQLAPDGFFMTQTKAKSLRGEMLVFAIALISIFTSMVSERGLTDHVFMVKGIPESDALAWYEMSVGLADGHGLEGGFSNQRPYYTIYLGALLSVFGVHLTVAQAFNALCLALAAAGIYTLGKLINSRLLGLVLSINAMAATTHLDYVHAIISENGGTVLAVLSLISVWQAAWVLSLRWSFLAGLLNGLAALTSGVTLLTLPLYALILFFFPIYRRTAWQHAFKLTALYTLAATLAVGSWLVRQKVVNDRFTLSFNTAEVLAGGSDPESGKLDVAVFAKAKAVKVDLNDANERYRYFMQAFQDNVSRDPGGYVRQLGRAFLASVDFLPYRAAGFHLTILLGLFGFGLWPALQRGHWLAFVAACSLMAWWAISEFTVTPTMMLAACVLAWRRSPLPATRLVTLLLIATLVATMLISAVSGNVATKRFWLVADWSAFALLLAGSKHLILTIGALSHFALKRIGAPAWLAGSPPPVKDHIAAASPPPFIATATFSWLSLSLICGLIVLIQTWRGTHSNLGPLDKIETTAIINAALQQHATHHGLPSSIQATDLDTRISQITDLTAQMEAGEGTQHWLGVYGPRPYDRWISKMNLLDANGERLGTFNALGQGQSDILPEHQMVIVAGVFTESINSLSNRVTKLLETCLVIPLIRDHPDTPWQPDLDHCIWFPLTPEAQATLNTRTHPSSPTQR